LIEIIGLRAWKKGAEDKFKSGILKTVLFIVGGVAAGYTIRIIID